MSAPLTELKFGQTVRAYERIKLGLIVAVLVLNLAIGGYLVSLTQTNQATLDKTKQSLVILQCAVDHRTSTGPNGVARSHADAQRAFDACVKAGGPKGIPAR